MTNKVRFQENKVCSWRKSVEGCVAAIAVLGGFAAHAATWNKTDGGNLDDSASWLNAGGTYAIRVQQTAPFSISADKAGLPSGASIFQYDYSPRSYTNHFASGWTFAPGCFLYVQGGATLVQESGVMSPVSGSIVTAQDIGGSVSTTNTRYVVSGADAKHEGNYLRVMAATSTATPTGPVQPDLIVDNGARVSLSQELALYGGWSVSRSLVTGEGSSVTASKLEMGGSVGEVSPGLVRELAFDDHATGSFLSPSTLGLLAGGNRLAVRNGASVAFGSTVNLSSSDNATSNNVIEVCGGTLTFANSLTIGSSNRSWGNGLVVREGGVAKLTGDQNKFLEVGNPGTDNFITVSGEDSLLDCGSAKLFVGGRSGERDGTHDRNAMTVADGAAFSSGTEVHVGRFGNDCRLSVTNGSTFAAGKLCLYATSAFSAESSDVTITNGITFADGDGSATFRDSTVHFVFPSMLTLESNGGVLSFVGSEVETNHRFNPSGAVFTMRFNDSRYTFTPDELFITGSLADASETRRYVFEGANPHLKITGSSGMHLRGTVTLEFNIPDVGFPTDHPVIDLQNPSAEFKGDNTTKTDRTLVVNVSDACPPGTYTLLRGKNANTLFEDGTITCTSPKTKIKVTTVDGVAAIQAKVSGGMLILFR